VEKLSELLDATGCTDLPYFMKAISLERDPWQFAFIIKMKRVFSL